jgi:hypothetical protein
MSGNRRCSTPCSSQIQRSTRSVPLKVRDQAPDENVVFRCYDALDAASRRRGVFTDPQAFLSGTPKKCVAHNHSQGSAARQVTESLAKRDHFAKARSASVALERGSCPGVFQPPGSKTTTSGWLSSSRRAGSYRFSPACQFIITVNGSGAPPAPTGRG